MNSQSRQPMQFSSPVSRIVGEGEHSAEAVRVRARSPADSARSRASGTGSGASRPWRCPRARHPERRCSRRPQAPAPPPAPRRPPPVASSSDDRGRAGRSSRRAPGSGPPGCGRTTTGPRRRAGRWPRAFSRNQTGPSTAGPGRASRRGRGACRGRPTPKRWTNSASWMRANFIPRVLHPEPRHQLRLRLDDVERDAVLARRAS